MEYGIQRRGIYLVPPDDDDLGWMLAQFEDEEVWRNFGFEGSGRLAMLRAFRRGETVTGILRRTHDRARIGFVVMFPPDEHRDYWEFSYAIPEVADRDAFSALSSTDAMAHYMFEHLGVEAMGWRVRADNRAAHAVVRRLGYQPFEDRVLGGHAYTFYRLSRAGWAKRRAKLDAGEAQHPSGLGATFLTLAEPPFEPTPLPERAPEPAPASSATAAPKPGTRTKTAPRTSRSRGRRRATAGAPAHARAVSPESAEAWLAALDGPRLAQLGYAGGSQESVAAAQRRGRIHLVEILDAEGAIVGGAVLVPPTESLFRSWELDLFLLDGPSEATGAAALVCVATHAFAEDPERDELLVPVPDAQPAWIAAAEAAGLERLKDREISPLGFRHHLPIQPFRVRNPARLAAEAQKKDTKARRRRG